MPVRPPGVVISKKLVLINSMSSLVAKVLSATVLIWVYQYLVKRVDAAEYSLLPLVTSLMVFAPLVTAILTSGMGRFILEAHAKGDDARVRQIVSSMLPILAGVALLILAIGGLLTWNIGRVLTIAPDHLQEARLMFGVMLSMFAVRLICAPFGVGLFVHQKYIWANLISVSSQLIRIVLLLVLLKCLGARIVYVVLANATSELASIIATQIISLRILPTLRFSRSDIRGSITKSMLSFGGWNLVTELGATIRQSADVIILNKLATPVDVATFDLGSMPDRTIRQTTIDITAPLMPALTALHAMDARERMRNAFLKGGKYSLFLALFVATPLIIYRSAIYQVYLGNRYSTYASAATVMALLLMSYPLLYSNTMLFKVAYAQGKIRGIALLTVVSQLLNLALTIYFVRNLHLGAVGSALGTLITDCAVQFGIPAMLLSVQMVDVPVARWFKQMFVPGVLPAIIAGMVWWTLQVFFPPQNLFALVLNGTFGAFFYFIAIFIFSLDSHERMQALKLIQSIRHRTGSKKTAASVTQV